MKYGVISDLHCHDWSMFSKVNPDGVNSRLRIILDELVRAVTVMRGLGIDSLMIAGDIFHRRGVLDPEVLNPVREVFHDLGMMVEAIPGNHDLKSADTRELSSAIQNLVFEDLKWSFSVHNKPTVIYNTKCFVPWRASLDDLLKDIEQLAEHQQKNGHLAKSDLFIHAGIDGVLSGIPGSGLTATKLSSYGFRNVFAGHYHNHKNMGDGVYSIGATTHQTWSDVGTQAGFLVVDDDTGAVEFHDTMAPKFIDLSGMDEFEMEVECKGNYVRFRGKQMTQAEIAELRDQFTKWGARGVSIEVPRALAATRSASPAKARTLDQSVEDFIDGMTDLAEGVDKEAVKKRAASVLADVRAISDDNLKAA